jgi:hypothetical protein
VRTLDGVEIEVTHGDAGVAPDTPKGGQYLNTTVVWYKPKGGEWQKSKERSAIKTCDVIKHSNLAELKEKL